MKNVKLHIDEWAETLTFDQLNPMQKQAVLGEMSEAEYSEIHLNNQSLNTLFELEKDDLVPDPESLPELKKRMETQNRRKPIVIPLWRKPVPIYAAGAACAVVFALTFWFNTGDDNVEISQAKPVEEKIYTKVIHDTVYLNHPDDDPTVGDETQQGNAPHYTHHTNASPKPQLVRRITTTYEPDRSVVLKVVSETPDKEGIQKSFGNSTVDLASLEQFKFSM